MRWALGSRCALPLGTVWGALGTTTTQGMIGEFWLLVLLVATHVYNQSYHT